MNHYLAQNLRISGQEIQGPLKGIEKLSDVITVVTTFLFPFAGVILFFVLVAGGYDFLMSGGSPEKIKSGQAKITTGIIGFALLIFSYLIAKFIAATFGLGGGIL